MQVTTDIYLLAKKLPKEELYALSDQIRCAAISIPSNIAEGQERGTDIEFIRFLRIAQGSRAEVETQLTLCEHIGYLTKEDITPINGQLEELGKMINSLITRISSKEN